MGYQQRELALLWGLSGTKCAYPGCDEDLADKLPSANIGDICHIVARKEGGPRWTPDYPPEKLNSYDNLVLLCPNHHRDADSETSNYTADDLRSMKATHEAWVRSRLSLGRAWQCNVEQLYYVNVPRLAMLAAVQGEDLDLTAAYGAANLHDLGPELLRPLVAFERVVSRLSLTAVTIDANRAPDVSLVGTTCSFAGNFRTRGFPSLEDVRSGKFQMLGDAVKDPCVYTQVGSYRLLLSINPRWATTTTSIATFRAGSTRLAGLATVKQVDANTKVVYATPMFIGIPKSPL